MKQLTFHIAITTLTVFKVAALNFSFTLVHIIQLLLAIHYQKDQYPYT